MFELKSPVIITFFLFTEILSRIGWNNDNDEVVVNVARPGAPGVVEPEVNSVPSSPVALAPVVDVISGGGM